MPDFQCTICQMHLPILQGITQKVTVTEDVWCYFSVHEAPPEGHFVKRKVFGVFYPLEWQPTTESANVLEGIRVSSLNNGYYCLGCFGRRLPEADMERLHDQANEICSQFDLNLLNKMTG